MGKASDISGTLPLTLLTAALFVCALLPRNGRSAPPQAHRTVPDSGYAAPMLPTYHYTEGIKHALAGRDSLAAIELRRAVEIDSAHAPSYFELATLLAPTDPEQALPYSRRACELDSTNIWYESLYGRLNLLTERYDQALDIYKRLLVRDRRNPDNYRLAAILYNAKGQPFTAIAILDSAEMRLGVNEMLSPLKRQLLIATKQYDRALEQTRNLIAAAPYQTENYVVLAELYAHMRNDSLARAAYRQALSLDSTDVPTLLSLADFYNSRGDAPAYLSTVRKLFLSQQVPLEEKIAQFRKLTDDISFYRQHLFQLNDLASVLYLHNPGSYPVSELYAGHLIATGRMEQALEVYKKHLADPEQRIDTYHAVLELEQHLGRKDSVDKYMALALQTFPHSSELYIRRAGMLLSGGRNREALKAYSRAIKYAPDDSVRGFALGLMADARYHAGDVRRALRAYEQSLRLLPDNALALNNYAYYLAERGEQLEKALAMSRKAVEMARSNATYLDTYAWVLYRLGRYEEAKQVMQQAIPLDSSQSPELMLHYGDILHALGEEFMARTYWQKALENDPEDPDAVRRRLDSLNRE